MTSIKNYLKLSDPLKTYKEEFTSSDFLINHFLDLTAEEQKGILNHYVVDGRAAAVKEQPLLYDQIISYMAEVAHVPVSHVKIVGSFKLGFCSGKDFGRAYSSNSDIDMTIFDEQLFKTLTDEYNAWKSAFESGVCVPHSPIENTMWTDNVGILHSKISKGFIDTYMLPNRPICPTIKDLHNAAYLIEYKLKEYYNYTIKKNGVSIRVYKTYEDFISTLLFNTKNVIEKINQQQIHSDSDLHRERLLKS